MSLRSGVGGDYADKQQTREAMAVVVMPVIMLGMVAADAPLHA
jgi:hypothetical protein